MIPKVVPGGRAKIDILIVSPGTTLGHRTSAELLAGSLRRLGLNVEVAFGADGVAPPPRWLPNALLELREAAHMRRKTTRIVSRANVRSLIYCSTPAIMLQPRSCLIRSAVHFDQLASVNRREIRNTPQRWLERWRLPRVRLLLPWNRSHSIVQRTYGVPVVALPPTTIRVDVETRPRRRCAVAYCANPEKKRLHVLVEAWRIADVPGAELLVTGIDEETGLEFLQRRGVGADANGVRWSGRLTRDEYRRAVGASHVFVSATRREEFGLALFEALAEGTLAVTVPTEWPTDAVAIARQLDPRLAPEEQSVTALAAAIKAAFAYTVDEAGAYRHRARDLLAPYGPSEWERRLRNEVVPILLPEIGGVR